MTMELIRSFGLSLPGAEESLPFGPDALVFKVKGKMFLLLALDTDPLQFNVKCEPGKAEELRETYEAVLPGYHMNKKHWNTVLVDGTIPARLLQEWIKDSYNLVNNKTRR